MEWYTRAFEITSPWSYGVLMLQTMLVAVIVERAIVLFFQADDTGGRLVDMVCKLVRAGDLDRAEKFSRILVSPFARVARAGVEAAREDPAWVREAAEKAAKAEIPWVWKRFFRLLGVAAAVAAVGAVGTVVLLETPPVAPPVAGMPFDLPWAWAPALLGGASGAVGFVAAAVFWWKASSIGRRLLEVPRRLEAAAYEGRGSGEGE